MNVSLFQAAAAMNANSRWQEVISENLASASVPGYRHQDVSFQSVAGESGKTSENGSVLASMAAPKAVTSISLSPGPMRPTQSQTDIAISGPGFFEVSRPDGTKGYTRDGEFHFDDNDILVTKQGYQVMGANGVITRDKNLGQSIDVSSNGDVSQQGLSKGKIKLVEFTDASQLRNSTDGTLEAADGANPVDSKSTVRQRFLEESNTSVVNEMADMIQAMRSFEANQKVIRISDERMSRAISQLAPTQ